MLIIGEKINSSIPSVKKAIAGKDRECLAALARDQAEAGADYIDVNAGDGRDANSTPVAIMHWLMAVVQEATDRPLCIDSDDPAVLEAALAGYRGDRVMVNSITAEPERLQSVGRIVAEAGALVIALVMKGEGIPRNVEERLEAADIIMDHLTGKGVPPERVYFDPLVLPISVDSTQGLVTLKTIEALKKRYPAARTVMGLSNISYGLPGRGIVNRSFMLMAASAGLDAAILNPLDEKMMGLVKVADMLTSRDAFCRRYTRAYRKGLLTE